MKLDYVGNKGCGWLAMSTSPVAKSSTNKQRKLQDETVNVHKTLFRPLCEDKCKPIDDRAGTGNDPLAAADCWQTVMGIRTHADPMQDLFMDWFPITQAKLQCRRVVR